MNQERQFLKIEFMIQTLNVKEDQFIHLKQELPTMENGKEVSVMVMVSKNGQTVPFMKGNGKIIELMVKVNLLISMETSTKDSG